MTNPNILSQRYATKSMNDIFSEEGKIILERELWIAMMKAQKKLGVNIPSKEIEKYEKAKYDINMDLIRKIESKTKHDVKARIEVFVKTAGAEEHIHKAMTSRDLTDNVEQIQIIKASKLIFGKYISTLRHFVDKAKEYKDIAICGRTHHQIAQMTLLGRRMSMWCEELYENLIRFENFIKTYPIRGVKGAIGTQSDMINLLGSEVKVEKLEEMVSKELGFDTNNILISTGQVYPRSLDYALISNLAILSSACESYAKSMRLMAGADLVTEGFKKGQVGSSAMPHKMNTRSSERICGFANLLKMYATGASMISGDQWEEGDVSESVVRRVIIPDSFYVSDGLCETTLTVLNGMGPYPAIIEMEIDKYQQFLATTTVLTESLEYGIGREKAHEIIKKYAIEEALNMKEKGHSPDIGKKLAEDPIFKKVGFTKEKIESIFKDTSRFIGNAKKQIGKVIEKAECLLDIYKEEAKYEPKEIL